MKLLIETIDGATSHDDVLVIRIEHDGVTYLLSQRGCRLELSASMRTLTLTPQCGTVEIGVKP